MSRPFVGQPILIAAAIFSGLSLLVEAQSISPNALKADVSFLASDALEGRGTPSRGLDIAAEFVASQFRRAALEPAGDDGYFQTAGFTQVAPVTEGLDLSFDLAGRRLEPAKGSIAVQDPAPADLKQAPAIKLADPAAIDALSPDQVRGKVLIVTALTAPRRIQSSLERLHPALVILFRPAGAPANPNPRLREASAGAVPILIVSDPAIPGAIAAAKEVAVSAHIPPPVTTPVKLHNVIGILRGSDPSLKDTYLILTAHYDHLGIRGTGEGDHIYNGANDDASGTASLIEIANALAAPPQRPKRSIIFIALFGEEMGELGSRYYVQHPVFPLAKTVADINLEQLGRTDETDGPRVGQFNLTGFDYTDMPAIFRKAGEETGIKVVKDVKNSNPYFTRSDNAAFALAGVPSTTISVAYAYPDYHGAGDEWPKLDYDNMARVDRTIALAALDFANSLEAPRWNAAVPATERFIRAREGAGTSSK